MATYIKVDGGARGDLTLLQRNRIRAEANRFSYRQKAGNAELENQAVAATEEQLITINSTATATGNFRRRAPVTAQPGANKSRIKSLYFDPTPADETSLKPPYFEQYEGDAPFEDPSSPPPYNLVYNGYNHLQLNKRVPFVFPRYIISGDYGSVRFNSSYTQGQGITSWATASGFTPGDGASAVWYMGLAGKYEPGRPDYTLEEDFSIPAQGEYTIELMASFSSVQYYIGMSPYGIVSPFVSQYDDRYGIALVGNQFVQSTWYDASSARVSGMTHFALSGSPLLGTRLYIGGVHILTAAYKPFVEGESIEFFGFGGIGASALTASSSSVTLRRVRITPRMLYKGDTAVPRWR